MLTTHPQRVNQALIGAAALAIVVFVSIIALPGGSLADGSRTHLLASRLFTVALISCGAGFSWVNRVSLVKFVKAYFTEPTHPINLAVARIVTFSVMLVFTLMLGYERLQVLAGLDPALRYPPAGYGKLLALVPITPTLVIGAYFLLIAACILAILGLATRITTALATLLGLYVFLIPQAFGKIDHFHHLIWFGALMAVSSSGDALSLDRLFARRGIAGGQPDVKYALPIKILWLLLGMVYFFPGFYKWMASGVDWALSKNMPYQLYSKWAEFPGWTPMFHVDHSPVLYALAGFGTMAFEIGFIFLLLNRKTRWIAALGGIGFHLSVFMMMRINFWSLPIFYLTFVDWARLFGREETTPVPRPPFKWSPVMTVGALLLGANLVAAGLKLTDGWPFALYPSFHVMLQKAEYESVQFSVLNESGAERVISQRHISEFVESQRWRGMLNRALGATAPDEQRQRFKALWALLKQYEEVPVDAQTLRVTRVVTSSLPEDVGQAPLKTEMLLQTPL